ncbi:MAG: DUF2617 family protein [Pseudomonadota bacterium]
MEYIDQQADQLHLNVIRGAVPRSQVQVLCSGELQLISGSIHASIIGASHFFEWKNPQGETIFSEVFACQKVEVAESLFYANINQADAYTNQIEGVDYLFQAEQRVWDEDIMSHFKKLCDKVSYQAGFALIFQFPDTSDSKSEHLLHAVTMLSVLQFNNQIIINSLHAYPKEKQLVLSQTTLKPPSYERK